MPKGCGNPEPAAPITTPGCFGDRPPQSTIICGGIEKPDPGPIHTGHTEPPSFETPIFSMYEIHPVVKKILEGSVPGTTTAEGTLVYLKPKTFEDAVKDFEDMGLTNIKAMPNNKGFVGTLPDGKTINVRNTSKGNKEGENMWPTIEIYNPVTEDKEIKIRYTGEKQS
jgi:hypothetical protein